MMMLAPAVVIAPCLIGRQGALVALLSRRLGSLKQGDHPDPLSQVSLK